MTLHGHNRITYFAQTNFRGVHRPFGIRQHDRLSHMYAIGKTGTGKSTLLATMAVQDLHAGQGFALLDPHGDLVERVLSTSSPEHERHVLHIDVANDMGAFGFNPLAAVPATGRPLAAENLVDVFKKIWFGSWGPRLEYLLRNAILALLDQPEPNLAHVLRLLDDTDFRTRAAERVANPEVRRFWLREYGSYPVRFRAEAIAPVQNKVGAFLANPILRRIVTQPTSTFDPRHVMDEGRVVLINLAKGRLGEENAALLGSLLVSAFGFAALGRADVPEHQRQDFSLYVDEFPTFTTLSFANMLAELRKYHVGLILAHQYLAQLEEQVRGAILGNVGTMIAFRVGPEDAEIFAKEFAPEFSETDLINLPNYNVYLKLMVNGTASAPFSAELPAMLSVHTKRA